MLRIVLISEPPPDVKHVETARERQKQERVTLAFNGAGAVFFAVRVRDIEVCPIAISVVSVSEPPPDVKRVKTASEVCRGDRRPGVHARLP